MREEARPTRFEELAKAMGWGPATQATYWAAAHSLALDLGMPQPRIIAATQKRLDKAKQEAPRWSPGPSTFADLTWANRVLQLDPDTKTSLLPLLLAFGTGHRIGDILKLETRNVALDVVFPCLEPVHRITVTRGKTVPSTGPYSIFIATSSPFNDTFVLLVRNCLAPFLFLPEELPLTVEDDALERATEKEEASLHHVLKKHGLDLDLRGIRRGGTGFLSSMAALGFSNEKVLTFSRHKSAPQLTNYLSSGAYDGGLATLQTTR